MIDNLGATAGAAHTSPVKLRTALATSVAAVSVARIFSLVAAAAQLPILTRLLTPAEFAIAAAAIAAASYVSLAAAEAPSLAFQRFPGSAVTRTNFAFARRQAVRTTCLITLLAIVTGLSTGHLPVAAAALGWGLGLATMRFVSTAWLMWGAPWRYSLTLIASTGIRTTLLLVLTGGGLDVSYAICGAGLASAAVGALLSPRGRDTASGVRPWPRYIGLSLATASAALGIITTVDRIVLPQISDPAAAGQYAAMATVASLSVGAFLGLMGTALFPRVLAMWDSGDHRGALRWTSQLTVLSGTIAISASLVTLLVGPDVLAWLVGAAYVDVPVAACLLAASGLYGMAQQLSWRHNLRLEAARIRNACLIAAMCNIVLLLILAPYAGTRGAAAATAAAFFAYALLVFRKSDERIGTLVVIVMTFGVSMASLMAPSHVAASISLGCLIGVATRMSVSHASQSWRQRSSGDERRRLKTRGLRRTRKAPRRASDDL